MPDKKPIDASILDRVVSGVRYALTGNAPKEWFGPGQPVAPQAQDKDGTVGRRFDFPVTANIRRQPRDGEGVSFEHLRNFADGYDLLRIVIETRKDQMSKMRWKFGPKDKKAKPDARCDELNAFFQYPDQEHDWDTWLRALLEDLLVLDAATLYPRMTLGDTLYGLELVDGATIKRLIDSTGRTPLPPDPAYQQILKGMPAVNYSRDELLYRPRNVRTNKVYGYSPVEQVIMTVNIALRRQLHQLQYYTEGNVPEALIGVPPEWNPEHIKQFQEYWDSILEGNTAARRHAKFVPGGMNVHMTKEAALTDKYDEWLARIICFAFSISPQSLVAQMNRATAETADAQAKQEGLQPLMNWTKNLIDYVAWKWFGHQDLEFKWEEEDDTAPKDQAVILKTYVDAKIMHPDEARDKLGLDPLTDEQKEDMKPAPVVDPLAGTPADGKDVPGGTKPGAGKDKGSPDPADAAATGGTDKPVGKLQGSGQPLAKARIARSRAKVKAATNAFAKLVGPALAGAGKRVAKSIREGANKAISTTPQARRLIQELTFDELRELAPELAEVLSDMAADGGEVALAQVIAEVTKDQLSQVNEGAVRYAKQRAAELVTQLEDSTRELLRASVAQGLEEGWSNDRLAAELEGAYAFSPERAEMIARTETAYADVQGNLEGYRASGVVSGKEWIIAQDEFCDECNDLNGVVVGLNESFPGDGGDGPPLHPNCRCDILPVLIPEED